jgi:hypothetical protein
LIDYNVFRSFDGNDLVSSIGDDKDDNSSVLDFTIFSVFGMKILSTRKIQLDIVFFSPGFYVSFYNRTLPSFHTSVATFSPLVSRQRVV